MKIIKCLSELIEDELHAAKCYIDKAHKYKEEFPQITDNFYRLSLEEMKHVDILHDDVVRTINAYREESGDPPSEMLFLYEYLHEKHIKKAKEIRILQEMYK